MQSEMYVYVIWGWVALFGGPSYSLQCSAEGKSMPLPEFPFGMKMLSYINSVRSSLDCPFSYLKDLA